MMEPNPADHPQIYRSPFLDSLEDVEQYRRGGHHPINLGDILSNKYKVIHKLGHGGFATIWLARNLQENQYVAIKVLSANAPVADLKFLSYLRDHGGKHPNIISLQEAFRVQGPNGLHQCLVFDSIGPSLKRITYGQHRLSKTIARNAARKIAEGLAYLHSTGIGHGDLTSSNILFEMKNINGWSEAKVYQHLGQPRTASLQLISGALPGPYAPRKVVEDIKYKNLDEEWLTGNVRIIDFGEAFFLNNPRVEFLGTPASYFAPEMLFGRSASAASDVWALGCLIYEIQVLRPLICVFFGTMDEALAEIVQTLGPLPTAWRHSYYDKTHKMEIKPGQNDPWFNPSKIRHPLESRLCEVKPQLSAKEIASLLDLLKGALEYENSHRSSAKQIATHAWFV